MKGDSELKHKGTTGEDRQRETCRQRTGETQELRLTGSRERREDRGGGEEREEEEERREKREREREREICGDWSPFIHSTHLAYLAGADNEISSF